MEQWDFNTEVTEGTESGEMPSGAALDQVFGDFSEARGALTIGRKFGDGFRGKFIRDLV